MINAQEARAMVAKYEKQYIKEQSQQVVKWLEDHVSPLLEMAAKQGETSYTLMNGYLFGMQFTGKLILEQAGFKVSVYQDKVIISW